MKAQFTPGTKMAKAAGAIRAVSKGETFTAWSVAAGAYPSFVASDANNVILRMLKSGEVEFVGFEEDGKKHGPQRRKLYRLTPEAEQ